MGGGGGEFFGGFELDPGRRGRCGARGREAVYFAAEEEGVRAEGCADDGAVLRVVGDGCCSSVI